MTEVNLPRRGRPAKPLILEVLRDITDEDLAGLADAPKVVRPSIQKLRSIHYTMAKLVASGMTNVEVAIATGRTKEGVSLLLQDPAFKNLVSVFQDQAMQVHLDDTKRIAGKLTDIAEMAIDEIARRLEDDNVIRQMPVGELRQASQMALDRTVAPPKQTAPTVAPPVTIKLDFGGKGFRNEEQKFIDKPKPQGMIDITPNVVPTKE
jgi:hypothetical protein